MQRTCVVILLHINCTITGSLVHHTYITELLLVVHLTWFRRAQEVQVLYILYFMHLRIVEFSCAGSKVMDCLQLSAGLNTCKSQAQFGQIFPCSVLIGALMAGCD